MKKLPHDIIFANRPSLDELRQKRRYPISVVVDDVRSLYNVGSIFRTSDGALIEKLYLCGITGYPPRKEIDKTALRAVDSVPWEHRKDAVKCVESLKNSNSQIIVLEHTDKSIPYYQCEYNYPCVLVLGNEVNGISEAIIEMADKAIEIPMFGLKQSLNVTVAYGIVIYDMVFKCSDEEV